VAGISLLAVAGCTVWGLASYVSLMRLEVRVTDASERVGATSRSRAQLAANVIHASAAFDCLTPERRDTLRHAAERAGHAPLAADIVEEPERYREFLSAQDELTSALENVWSLLQSNGDIGARVLVEDLRGSVEQLEANLHEQIGELEQRVDAYHAGRGQFPRSWIAAIAGGKRASVADPRSAAAAERPPATGAGPG
jgi:hypothetical protein